MKFQIWLLTTSHHWSTNSKLIRNHKQLPCHKSQKRPYHKKLASVSTRSQWKKKLCHQEIWVELNWRLNQAALLRQPHRLMFRVKSQRKRLLNLSTTHQELQSSKHLLWVNQSRFRISMVQAMIWFNGQKSVPQLKSTRKLKIRFQIQLMRVLNWNNNQSFSSKMIWLWNQKVR